MPRQVHGIVSHTQAEQDRKAQTQQVPSRVGRQHKPVLACERRARRRQQHESARHEPACEEVAGGVWGVRQLAVELIELAHSSCLTLGGIWCVCDAVAVNVVDEGAASNGAGGSPAAPASWWPTPTDSLPKVEAWSKPEMTSNTRRPCEKDHSVVNSVVGRRQQHQRCLVNQKKRASRRHVVVVACVLPPPPLSAQCKSAFSSGVARSPCAVSGDEVQLKHIAGAEAMEGSIC